MHSSVIFSLAAGALIASASPVQSIPRGVHTVQGLGRRSFAERAAARNLTVSELAALDRDAIQAKYARHVATLSAAKSKKRSSQHARRQTQATLPLTDVIQDGVDELYYGTLGFGTPSQALTLDFDTGSSDLWVPTTRCTNCVDDGTLYNTGASSTYKPTNQQFLSEYGSGAVEGVVATETVTFGNLTSTSQYFGAVTQVTSSFDDDPASGLAGLAFVAISEIGQPGLPFNLAAQGKLAANKFALLLARDEVNGSELTMGGVAPAYANSNFQYTSVTSETYWEVQATGVEVGGTNVYPSGFLTAVDSGTTIIYLPTQAANALYSAIPNAQSAGQGQYVYPCSYTGTIAFNFNGISSSLSINSSDFNLGEVGQGYCQGAVMGADMTDANNNPLAIVGDTFLKNYYTVFDFSTNPPRVGFTNP